ncbi:unnamed protein product [Heterobilharzia americana]|nr:unnamed protein product [Heterobilharzia americana]
MWDDEAEKQFPTAVRNLLNSSPCGNDLLSKTDVIKQSVHRRGKTITNTKLDFNYPVIDDCLSVNSSSSHDLRDSRNSSSSPYVSSLSSANRSPNSQMDEIPPALNSTTNHSESTLRSVQSHNLSMVSEDELNKNKSDQPPHIRIKFRISNSTGNQDHPLNVEIKSSPPDDKRNTSQSHSPKNTNDNDKLDNIDKDHSTSVANRRIMRKCRQLLSHDLSHVTNSKSSNNRTIVLRKRIQKCLLNSNNTGSTDKSTSPQSNSPSSCKLNRHNNNRSNKLKHAHVHSRSDLRNNLDILHNHTVTNVHSKPTPTKYGMNDKRFSAYAFHYQPVDVYTEGDKNYLKDSSVSDIHIGYNKAPVPLALTQYLELTKQAFMDHFAMLQSPAYASTIKSELERERNRQTELLKHTKALEQSIAKLHADGTELLNRFTKRLGILITTPAAFFAQARRLIKHHHALEEKISEFRKQISHLSAANQELVKRHQIEAARLLAAATMNKSDNASQHHQHQQYSSNQSAYVSDVKTTQARRNGFCHDPTNIPPSTVTRSGLVNGLNSTLLSSALMIPPPPSLTKVSNNTADSSNYHYPPIVPSDRLVFSHETPQHSLGSLPSSNLKYTTSVASPIFLHNNSSSNTAPILLKTLNTTSPSTTANVTFHVADCDRNIPPPPPLLPMHIHSDSPYTTSTTTTTTTTSAVWSSSPSYHNRHYFMDNNDISNDIPSLLPEINRSFITSRTDYEASNSQASRHHHYNKSMHASTPAISINNSVSTINANNKSICSNSSDSVCDYLQEQRYPDSPIQRHRHHHHNHDRHSNNHHHHKGVQPNSIDYSHQFNLPPRKRHWDSHNSIVTTSINNVNFDENCISSKLPRNHSFISSSSSSSSTTTQHHNKNTSWSQNLSPPTLSPVSLDDVPSTTDFSLQFDQHDINSSFPPCHNSNNFNVTATSTGELNKN